MTKKELSRLYWLNKEIQWQKKELKRLESSAEKCTTTITGMPHGSAMGSQVERFAILIAEQKELIENQMKQAVIEYNRLCRYIASIDDPQIRTILSLRYLDGLSWQNIASKTNCTDESTVRKIHNKFLKLSEKSETEVI